MTTTTKHSMDLLDVGQKEKEATINTALTTIDGLLAADLGEYTVAGLPAAASFANCYALATNASGGRTIVRSDGSAWKVVVIEGITVTT